MDNVGQSVPPVENQPPVKTSNNLSFAKALAYGFLIVSIGISIAVGGYLLAVNKTKPQSISKISTTPSLSPVPTVDPTANWKTYVNTRYRFEVKYPVDTRIVKEGAQGLVASINLISSDFRLSSTGVSISIADSKSCTVGIGTKNINGNTFLVAGESVEDDASGGERHISNTYFIARNNICYEIQSSIGYTSVEFSAVKPTSQEIQQEQDWIQTQKQLNNQILSTFKFTDQNQTVISPTIQANNNYLIKEFGIQFPLTDSLDGIYYVVNSGAGRGSQYKSVGFSTQQLATIGGQYCVADEAPIGIVMVVPLSPSQVAGEGVNFGTFVKQVGNEYIYYTHSQSVCAASADNISAINLQAKASADLVAQLKLAQKL